jgi:pimeloyl-ACP methyl ester carboxylesterase
MEFPSGGNVLRGFIDLPLGPGKHPAIIIVQGARPTDVTVDTGYFTELRNAFRRAGIATLIWDKAGNGCSSGAYSSELPIRERATETLAALKVLKDRGDIDSSRIGVWAQSQGGWIAPMVAVRSNGIAYLIILSGPGRDAVSQGSYLVLNLLREAGVRENEAHEAYVALRRASAIALGGGGPQELSDALKPLKKYSALPRADIPSLTNGAYLRAFQTDPQWSISAELFLQELDVPTLAIFGERDMQVDWRESIDVYHSAFARGGNGDLTIKTFQDADHDMQPPLNQRRLRHSIFVDGYIETMIEWLRAHNLTEAKD